MRYHERTVNTILIVFCSTFLRASKLPAITAFRHNISPELRIHKVLEVLEALLDLAEAPYPVTSLAVMAKILGVTALWPIRQSASKYQRSTD